MCVFKHKTDLINNILTIWLLELTRFHKKNVRFVQFPKANRIVKLLILHHYMYLSKLKWKPSVE